VTQIKSKSVTQTFKREQSMLTAAIHEFQNGSGSRLKLKLEAQTNARHEGGQENPQGGVEYATDT
jgi:hypothetical protein